MAQSEAIPMACRIDFARRSTVPVRRRTVLLAGHLDTHPSRRLADTLVADMRAGRSLERHLSPLANPRTAFKRGNRKGVWRDYRRMLDHLLNKWGFRHFHCGGGSTLAFVHLCEATGVARVLDLLPHDGDWQIERRLVGIAVRNWPDAEIGRSFGQGPSRMTEADLFEARKQGLNMVVNVDGTYYLPARGALLSDGTSFVDGFLKPIGIVARRFEPGKKPDVWLDSPHMLVLGADPDDPRPPWELAAAQGGMLSGRPTRLRQDSLHGFAVALRQGPSPAGTSNPP